MAGFASPLPIDEVLGDLTNALVASSRVVLSASPGAGKSTHVPLSLLGAPWLGGRRIIVLEPRRLAARAVARRMAFLLRENIGETVGYRMRGDTRVSARTRVEVVTEGVLTRMLLKDPAIEDCGAIIFDEFHERSINADLGLALSLQTQEVLRPELRILVMSATLDGVGVAALLGGAPVIESQARSYPIDVRYVAASPDLRVDALVANVVRRALESDSGSVLAFLPGAGEIRRCEELLSRSALPDGVRVLPLYGDLDAQQQDEAIRSASAGERKVVLATSIAETSLTIEGVRVVVDGGLSRVSRFSPRTGMARLETVRVSKAQADQRAGRAGRTSAGICYRPWPEHEQLMLPERPRPEILESDLAPVALDLAVAGVTDPSELRWLDAPPPVALRHARELLQQLGAIDRDFRVTAHGRALSAFGVHPRFAHTLVVAHELGFGATACVVSALLEERDVLRQVPGERDPDLRLRFRLVLDRRGRPDLQRVRARVDALRVQLGVASNEQPDESYIGHAVALAYPDRVAQQRATEGRYRLRSGVGAVLPNRGGLSREEFLAIAEVDGRSPDAMIYLAAPFDRESLMELFASDITKEQRVEWNDSTGQVDAVKEERLGALVLRERGLSNPDSEVMVDVLLRAIRSGSAQLPWTDESRRLRQRVGFLRARDPEWPDWSDPALLATMEDWLAPHLVGARRASDVARLPLGEFLLDTLEWSQRRELDRLAPTHAVVPTGSRIPIDYSNPESPRIAVRLQEVFGLEASPVVGFGVPLTIELLSPAHRPVQVTSDLAGFWRTSYHDVRKEMRGRYPRHEWPVDPLSATPTRRAKPRK